MAKLTRVTGKVFGGSAPLDEIGQFGSALAGNPTNTQDVATIQALDAYSKGWGSAVISSRQFPPIEEVTGALKTISYQGCYLLQEGIPEYDIDTEYSNTSIVKSINNGITTLYVSLANGNKGNALSNATYWKPYVLDQIQRNIGEIVTSTIPLEDAGLHLLDGALIDGNGSYSEFVTYLASLRTDYSNLFTTESAWQTSVTTYGVCGKFVYDSVNNTVRLPKITGIIEGTTDLTALGDLVQAGLPNITVSAMPSWDWASSSGALEKIGDTAFYSYYEGGTLDNSSFNASRCSSIYGNSTTVQPQTIKVLYYIVVATSSKTDIQVDIDEIATDLNGKADADLSNVPSSKGILVESYKNGTSWYRVYSDGWCEQGGYDAEGTVDYGVHTIEFLKPYVDTNYTLTAWYESYYSSEAILPVGMVAYRNKQTASFQRLTSTTTYRAGCSWEACGYIR